MPRAGERSADFAESAYLKALAEALAEVERTVEELHDLVVKAFAGNGEAAAALQERLNGSNRQLG